MINKMFRKTPLAWRQLMKEKTRLLVAVAGITFADMLIFIQMGFESALFDAAIQPHRNLQADLVLINPQFQTLFSVKSFSRERLYQALSYNGVKSVSSIYISTGQWRNPQTKMDRSILVWGVDPATPGLKFPELQAKKDNLKQLNQVIFDEASRPEYGEIGKIFRETGKFNAELSGKNVSVKGLFQNGASFAADGNVVVSDSTFLQLFSTRKADQIEVGLITLQPGADIEKVKAQLQIGLNPDPQNPFVEVGTPETFAQKEKTYWATGTGIGFIFSLGVIVGFIVGIVIVYQVLYSDVSDHLPEYATLKAMGYTDNYLLRVLLQEALFLAALGYLPAFFLSFGLYQVTFAATLLPISMKVDRAINVFILTVIMCTVSGAIAMRKLRSADPADIF
ncbi:FtsX-like permease family protein [Dolichospermum sp. LEGE 00240]|jgi:putative ABC transport system permease protein|uniref:ABC transporter permease DevC n=1 Tax=Aphanizomenonaceae TaxID=1892259 RepID=UPI00187E7C4F|nr:MULTISPECIES: ABC transporter permease DevC [Aphanizomenonaceae]MDM3845249.1 ABC transporter permease DevC [Aphanizomenon gracile PMC638.10]MDM3849688.1 ABC transporter permease DevC [Aphanizomenon gracile PMC627.10]MDM3854720.1 ABC transporter permease DevC [Aphanizomenon gracile PMC649.10]MDM3859283.1 ABC transporter permease DevC [Aphanizomenon gracile PMC644.10]MBE9248540.1 FtsX-like permease family protein [Dolichospermum sp. LEGE 00240]